MQTFIVKTVAKVTPDIIVLTLTPKSAKAPLQFAPGQYVSMGFKRGFRPTPMRCFSIASSPARRELQFAMRITGPFTTAAAELQPGEKVYLQGPFGDFVVDQRYDKQIVMMAGGIGITPFMSMLRYAVDAKQRLPMTLLYACRSLRDVPYLQEILTLTRQHPNLRVAFFVGDSSRLPADAPATVVSGRITAEHLAAVVQSYRGASYFLCGPQAFMQTQTDNLVRQGINADQIISESFAQQTPPAWGGLSLQKLTYSIALGAFVIGFGTIMALDLARNLPKVSAATTPSSQASPITSPTMSSSSSDATNTSNTSSSTNTASDTSTTSNIGNSSYNSQTYYQSPVSSVS